MTGSRRHEFGRASPTGGAAGEIDGFAPWIGMMRIGMIPIGFPAAHAISGNLPAVASYSALSLAGSRPAVPQ